MNPMQSPNTGVAGKDFGNNRNQCQGCQAGWPLEAHKPWPKGSKGMAFHRVAGGYKGEKSLCTKSDYCV